MRDFSISIDIAAPPHRLVGRMTAGITNRYLAVEANGLKLRAEAASDR